MKELHFQFEKYNTPMDALTNVTNWLLKGGLYNSYGVYYIWEKDGFYYSECETKYHQASLWRSCGYECFDIVKFEGRSMFDKEGDRIYNGVATISFNASKYYPSKHYFMRRT